jgi:hypothetical protein
MKHTPWPWREHEGFIIGRFNSDNEIHDICDPRCAPSNDADTICEMNANTLLIAAAPELLEACQEFVKHIKSLGTDTEKCRYLSVALNCRAGELIENAIAKATGEIV